MNMELEKYLSNGVEGIVKSIARASFTNPKASLFMARFAASSKAAEEKRKSFEASGEHIPAFLIASIADKCNLSCKGCYARANHSCTDCGSGLGSREILTCSDWDSVFTQAENLGIAFIILAGGEPFTRADVLVQAAGHKNIVFPIFTNGTLIDSKQMELLEKNRNLMPVISIEGNQETTDARRGSGVYEKLENTMKLLHSAGILFGASVTVTKQNMNEVLSDEFVHKLEDSGVKAVVYVEYVPVDEKTKELAPDDVARDKMMSRLDRLRSETDRMLLIAFPGDEKASGGCLAAGRGFIHINAAGGAEPCPFSPYSDTNVKSSSLRSALHSPLFCNLQKNGNLTEHHTGGCVLFEQKNQVEKMLKEHAL